MRSPSGWGSPFRGGGDGFATGLSVANGFCGAAVTPAVLGGFSGGGTAKPLSESAGGFELAFAEFGELALGFGGILGVFTGGRGGSCFPPGGGFLGSGTGLGTCVGLADDVGGCAGVDTVGKGWLGAEWARGCVGEGVERGDCEGAGGIGSSVPNEQINHVEKISREEKNMPRREALIGDASSDLTKSDTSSLKLWIPLELELESGVGLDINITEPRLKGNL